MADKIKIRRGLLADIPVLDEGEMGLVTDRDTVYIGTESNGNILLNPVVANADGYTIDGYLSPTTDNVHGLGTANKRWQSVSVGPGSLHIIAKDTDPGYAVNSEFSIGINSDTGKLQFVNNGNVLFDIDPNTGISISSTIVWVELSLGTSRTGNLATISGDELNATVVYAKGCITTVDGGGGVFYWSPSSTATDNGGTIIQPSSVSGAGRWLRIYDGEVNVKWFGATGDGTTDDTAAIQAAIDFVSVLDGTLYIPRGTYKFTNLNMTRINHLFDKSMTVRGDGPDATILEMTIPATGIGIDMSASNNMRFEGFQIRCGPNSDAGLLLSRFTDAQNCNLNHFTDFWIMSSTAKAGLISIAAESSVYIRCRFWVNAPQSIYIGATNQLGVTSNYGTIQTINSNIENHFYACQFIVSPGNVPVRLSDSNGVEFIGCATYNDNNATPITAHFLVENPTNTDGATWPTRIDHHLFEGKANTGILFKSASHGNGAFYLNFQVTNSWMSMEGSWVDIDMSDQGGSLFGIVHGDFLFENNASPQSQTPGSIHLNEVERVKISHYADGALVTIDGNTNNSELYITEASLAGIANPLCTKISLMNPYGSLARNQDIYGAVNGRAGRYVRYVPSTTEPDSSAQTSEGMIAVADPSGWDPLSLGGSTPYPVIYRGAAWRAFHVAHASSHASGGADELHANQIEMGATPSVTGFGNWAADSSIYDVLNGLNQGLLTGGDAMQIGTASTSGGFGTWAADSIISDILNGLNQGLASPTFDTEVDIVANNTNANLTVSTGGVATAGDAIIQINADGNQGHVIRSVRANNQMMINGGGVNVRLRNTDSTTTQARGIEVEGESTGDMADGFGAKIDFYIRDNSASSNNVGSIRMVRDGYDTSAHMEFHTNDAGSYAERMRLTKTGSLELSSAAQYLFSSTTDATGTADAGFARNTSGTVDVLDSALTGLGVLRAGALRTSDGSSTFPSHSFKDAPGHGMYRDGTTLGFCIDGVGRVAFFNQFGVLGGLNYVQIVGAGYLNSGGTNIINMSDDSDVGAAALRVGYDVSSPGVSDSPTVRMSRRIYTNSGAGSEFAVVMPSSANIGTEYTCYDVGGTGGISFIAPTGESIRVGLAVTSGAARKVKCTDGAGAELTLVKVTSTLWIQKGSFVGTWVGS
jgi:hypothetical protein